MKYKKLGILSFMTNEIYPDCLQSLLKWSKILSLFFTYSVKRYYIKTEQMRKNLFYFLYNYLKAIKCGKIKITELIIVSKWIKC